MWTTSSIDIRISTLWRGQGIDEESLRLHFVGFADDSMICITADRSHRFVINRNHAITSRDSSSSKKESFPSNLVHMVEDFERLISSVTYKSMERCELQTVCIKLLPCTKVLEVIEAAIYL